MLTDKNGLTESEFLARYRPGDYPRPSVTADILLFSPDTDGYELLLIRRGGHPSLGMWALPGGFANPDETVDAAAARELLEETHVEGLTLAPIGLFSDPGRDPRGWVITHAYAALADRRTLHVRADDDADDARWFHVSLADGVLMLTDGTETLRADLDIRMTQTPFGIRHDVGILSRNGIAFDHAKIITVAYLKLNGHRKTVDV